MSRALLTLAVPAPIWQAPDYPAAALQAEQAEIAAALEAKKAGLREAEASAVALDLALVQARGPRAARRLAWACAWARALFRARH